MQKRVTGAAGQTTAAVSVDSNLKPFPHLPEEWRKGYLSVLSTKAPDKVLIEKEEKDENIEEKILSLLSEAEWNVLNYRYVRCKSQSRTGKHLGLSLDQVRALEVGALKKLRASRQFARF